jgi:hypothetical protein
MNATVRFVLIGLGAALSFIALVIGFWVGDRQQPATYDNKSARVLGGSFTPGGEVYFEYRTNRLRDCALKVERFFDDALGVRHVLPDYDMATVQPLGDQIVRRSAPLPQGAANGLGHYRSYTVYKCNPLQALWPLLGPVLSVGVTIARGPQN